MDVAENAELPQGESTPEKSETELLAERLEAHMNMRDGIKPEVPAEEPDEVEEDLDGEFEEEIPATPAPDAWSKEDKELWGQVSPEVQAIIARREKEINEGFSKAGQERSDLQKRLEAVDSVYQKYTPALQARFPGADLNQVTDQLLNFYVNALNDPFAGIQWMANTLGVDLSQIQQDEGEKDPSSRLEQKISHLENMLATQTQQTQQTLERQQTQSIIDAWASQRDAAGNPIYPHYESLQKQMSSLIKSGIASGGTPQETLDAAYKAALKLSDMDTPPQKVQPDKEKVKRAAKARRAGSAVKTGGEASPAKRNYGDSRQDRYAMYREAMEEIRSQE